MQNKGKFNELRLIKCRRTGNNQHETFLSNKNRPETKLGMSGGIDQRPGATRQAQVAVKRASAPRMHTGQISG